MQRPIGETVGFYVVALCVVLLLGWMVDMAWGVHKESGMRVVECEKSCFPSVGRMLDDACHCATETGYKRLDGPRDDAERTSR